VRCCASIARADYRLSALELLSDKPKPRLAHAGGSILREPGNLARCIVARRADLCAGSLAERLRAEALAFRLRGEPTEQEPSEHETDHGTDYENGYEVYHRICVRRTAAPPVEILTSLANRNEISGQSSDHEDFFISASARLKSAARPALNPTERRINPPS
jgi:hypothetical protein